MIIERFVFKTKDILVLVFKKRLLKKHLCLKDLCVI